MKYHEKKVSNNAGFTLIEVLISVLILVMVVISATSAFVFASKTSLNNEIKMTAINLANQRIEYIRSLEFAKVGTKYKTPTGFIDGDPEGDILQEEEITVDGYRFMVYTTISWEEEGEWDLYGDASWDYKSVNVKVVPQGIQNADMLTQNITTYVTRNSEQPAIDGTNIRIRFCRGWRPDGVTNVPVSGIRLYLTGNGVARQTFSSSKGIGSFLGLDLGTYTVEMYPSTAGMILTPTRNSVNSYENNEELATNSDQFDVEIPCSLHLTLEDIYGSPIDKSLVSKGEIKITAPCYSSPIIKEFTSSDIDNSGRLPNSLISDLWPIGVGFPQGSYKVPNIHIPGYTYIESHDDSGTTWDGTFSAPGTWKNLVCYFAKYPSLTGSEDASFVNDSSKTISPGHFYAGSDNASFRTSNLKDTIVLNTSDKTVLNAVRIYMENTGDSGNAGLLIKRNSVLELHASETVFCGQVNFEMPGTISDIGIIKLYTTWEDSQNHTPPSIEGDRIPGGNTGELYGKLYLSEPMISGDTILVDAGVYYYPDGIELPKDALKLIRVTKDTYVD